MEDMLMTSQTEATEDVPNYVGVCTKCHFCMPKIDQGMSKGLMPGVDKEATPACVVSCTSKALYFGDANDKDSEIANLIKDNDTVCLQEEMGTKPRVYYIGDTKSKQL
jgi:phenylacetyl-CoA:acceptor oxidoreductase subunit 1